MEGIRSENVFSELVTSWYDYCLAKELYSRGVYCWSIEIAYYSALHSLRALMYTSMKLVKYFMEHLFKMPSKFKSHSGFCELLTRCDSLSGKSIEEQIIIDVLKVLNINAQDLKVLGNILKIMKKAREIHVYQHLVVAHQVRVIPMEPISSSMLNATFKTITECSRIIVHNFLLRITDKALQYCYLRHFIDEIEQFKRLLKLEHIKLDEHLANHISQVSKQVEIRLKELSTKLAQTEELEDTYQKFIELHRPTTHFNNVLREVIHMIICELSEVLKEDKSTYEKQ